MKLTFLGAAGTVTGSKYYIQTQDKKLLIDCGLFQGIKAVRERNWKTPPFNPAEIDAVLLTHAHIDHSGYLPLLVKRGFTGPIYCTEATASLCEILLPDSGYLQEEEAYHANLHGYSKHHPALPLYTREEAIKCLKQLHPVAYDKPYALLPDGHAIWHRASHILGASFIEMRDRKRTFCFSGDVGRDSDPIMKKKEKIIETDYLILESTYGGSLHDTKDPIEALEAISLKTIDRGGSLLIPAFSVGRVQHLLYYFYLLKKDGRIDDIPIYLDSPMAIEATKLLLAYPGEHKLSKQAGEAVCRVAHFINTPEESIELTEDTSQKIIISASGMLTGGRVLHHFKAMAPDSKNTVVLTGFQAPGTRGDKLLNQTEAIKIHGVTVSVKAEILRLLNLSAHADSKEILDWISPLKKAPKAVYLTHGTAEAAIAFQKTIEEKLKWKCHIAKYLQSVTLR